MSESLYVLSESYNNVLELLGDESIPEEAIKTALEEIDGDIEMKVSNGIGLLKSMQYRVEAVQNEIKRLTAYKKAIEKRIETVEGVYMDGMKRMGKSSVSTSRGDMKIRKNPQSVVLTDESLIPEVFKKQKIDIVTDKTAVKEALKKGEEVAGAILVQKERLAY